MCTRCYNTACKQEYRLCDRIHAMYILLYVHDLTKAFKELLVRIAVSDTGHTNCQLRSRLIHMLPIGSDAYNMDKVNKGNIILTKVQQFLTLMRACGVPHDPADICLKLIEKNKAALLSNQPMQMVAEPVAEETNKV